MRTLALRLLRPAGLAALLMSFVPVHAEGEDVMFHQLMDEAGMLLQCDDGYVGVPVVDNELLPYEKALRTGDGSMEIRFVIRPLARITIDYEDPHNAAPEPEHLFPLLFQSLTEQLSGGRHSPHREYPAEKAREIFNADWAAASTFDVMPGFNAAFNHGFMIAMHGVGKADAYTVMLFDDYETARPAINEALNCLVFASREPEASAVAE